MIDTFLFIRLLNPILSLKFFKRCVFWQEFEVWCLHKSSNLTSVESFWRHEFPKNSDVLQHSLTSTISSGLNSFFPLSDGYLCTPPALQTTPTLPATAGRQFGWESRNRSLEWLALLATMFYCILTRRWSESH